MAKNKRKRRRRDPGAKRSLPPDIAFVKYQPLNLTGRLRTNYIPKFSSDFSTYVRPLKNVNKNKPSTIKSKNYLADAFTNQPIKIGNAIVSRKSLVCVQRQIRKEIIHAKRKAGKTGQKSPTWTKQSQIICKRRK